jgi:UDP-glucose 4-epimerase
LEQPDVDGEPRLALVTGATGALGPAVVAELRTAGWSVRTLSRSPCASGDPPGMEHRTGDIADARVLSSAMNNVSAVVHLAARLHLAGPASRDIDAYRRVNVEGTTAVVAAARACGVQRVVLASTIAVYGSTVTVPATERTMPRPDTPYAETKLQSEHIARNARRQDGEPLATVLRFAAVYGPGVRGNYRTLVHALQKRRFVPIGSGRNRRTLVHERDAARAIVHVLGIPSAAGETYNVTDGRIHTTDDIVGAICAALRRPAPRLHVPRGVAFALAALYDRLPSRRADRISLFERLQRYTEDVAVEGSRLRLELGFVPVFSLEEGWADAVRAMHMDVRD